MRAAGAGASTVRARSAAARAAGGPRAGRAGADGREGGCRVSVESWARAYSHIIHIHFPLNHWKPGKAGAPALPGFFRLIPDEAGSGARGEEQ